MPTHSDPIEMECFVCGGRGCDRCEHGSIKIGCCPLTVIDAETEEVMMLADMYKKGLPPVDGGVLDQTHDFIVACRMIWNNERKKLSEYF